MAADENADDQPSAAPGLTRKEFFASVLKKASQAGALTAGAMLVDSFLAPPVYAQGSTGPNGCTESGCGDAPFQPSGTCPGCGGP